MAEQMRAFGRANALNRSADQSERTMMQRRRYEQANPPAEEMGLGSEPPAPDPEFDDAAMQAAVAMKDYLTARAPAGIEAAAPEAPPKPAAVAPGITARRPPLSVNSLQPPIATPATAIHYGLQSPNDSQLRTKPDSEAPPRHRATQHVVEQSGARRAL
jgi:hypothetical protein